MGRISREKSAALIKVGLHYCSRYRNLVKYNPEFCGKCPHNGLRGAGVDADPSETCF